LRIKSTQFFKPFADSIKFFSFHITSFVLTEMALNRSFTSASTASVDAGNSHKLIGLVPLYKRKGVCCFADLLKLAGEYGFGRDASPFLENRGKCLICTAQPYIILYGATNGEFCLPWKEIVNVRKGKMCQKLTVVLRHSVSARREQTRIECKYMQNFPRLGLKGSRWMH
jgi:hypothetical protein